MKCRLLRQMDRHFENPEEVLEFKRTRKMPTFPAGHFLENADAYKLVQMGVAEPADKECEDAVGMTAEELQQARRAYERTDKGIVPEDYELFNQGVIAGYDAEGNYIPGPNWREAEVAADAEEESSE